MPQKYATAIMTAYNLIDTKCLWLTLNVINRYVCESVTIHVINSYVCDYARD